MSTSVDYRKDPSKPSGQTCSSAPLPSSSLPSMQSMNPNSMRPRSLYATHSFHAQPEESSYQRYNDFMKYLEVPPADQWGANGYPIPMWRQPRNFKPVISPYYSPDDGCVYFENWREPDPETSIRGAIVTNHGTISLRLHSKVRVDITVDRAIRLINLKNHIVISLSSSGSSSALLHPNGRVYQYGSRVEILAHDSYGNHKYAKMWYKGVSFTSDLCALVYLVDAAGTRTTTDTFTDMSHDISVNVFYSESRSGPAFMHEASEILATAQYWMSEEGIENWIINNVRVSQTPDGLVRIARNNNKYQLRTSPSNGTASLTTPFLHCTASLGQTSHLFIRRGERRMHYDGTSFIVRNAGHSAGFDEKGQLKVY